MDGHPPHTFYMLLDALGERLRRQGERQKGKEAKR